MFTMGGDFNWENAHEWYKNLDKLIKYVNEKVRNVLSQNVVCLFVYLQFDINHEYTGKII